MRVAAPRVDGEGNDSGFLKADVLWWRSFQCVVGMVGAHGCVYDFWVQEKMSCVDAMKLGRSTPMRPVSAVLCGGLRWNRRLERFECDSIRTA